MAPRSSKRSFGGQYGVRVSNPLPKPAGIGGLRSATLASHALRLGKPRSILSFAPPPSFAKHLLRSIFRRRRLPHRVFRAASFAAFLLPLPARAVDKITYDEHILPLFEQSCLNCHNPDKLKGGLDLSNYAGVLQGGSGGKVAETGDGASSALYTTVIHQSENKMPPKGDKLPKKSADLILAWIDGGLLETASSTARKRRGPKIDLSIKTDATDSIAPAAPRV